MAATGITSCTMSTLAIIPICDNLTNYLFLAGRKLPQKIAASAIIILLSVEIGSGRPLQT